MKKSDWALMALNLFGAFIAFIGAVEPDEEGSVIVFFTVAVVLAVNSAVIARRARQRDDAPRRDRRSAAVDEMDARTVLDIDARLEALERAQDASDAARWRALAASGQVTAPAAEPPPAGDAARQPLNGRA